MFWTVYKHCLLDTSLQPQRCPFGDAQHIVTTTTPIWLDEPWFRLEGPPPVASVHETQGHITTRIEVLIVSSTVIMRSHVQSTAGQAFEKCRLDGWHMPRLPHMPVQQCSPRPVVTQSDLEFSHSRIPCQGSLVDKLLRDRLVERRTSLAGRLSPPKGQLSTDDIAVDYVAIRCEALQFRFDMPSLGLIPTAESPYRAGLVVHSHLVAASSWPAQPGPSSQLSSVADLN